MDTDDLSIETNRAIFIPAEKFDHDLSLQFGLLAEECTDDDDYLEKANQMINGWRKDLENSIEDIFFDPKKPTTARFTEVLDKIQKNIEKVAATPLEKRKFEF